MTLLFEAEKFDIFGRRDERIIDTSSLLISVQKQHSVRCFPTSKDGGCGFSSTSNEMGVFHGGFASSTSQFFASATHDGVLAGLLFLNFRYHTSGFGRAIFFSPHHHGSGDFQPSHDKKVF